LGFNNQVALRQVIENLRQCIRCLIRGPAKILDSQTRVGINNRLAVFILKAMRRVDQKDHGKFQPLGTMDRHDVHGIAGKLRGSLAKILIAFLHAFDKPNELIKSFKAAFFIAMRSFIQGMQIGLPLLSPWHAGHIVQIASFLIDRPNQFNQ